MRRQFLRVYLGIALVLLLAAFTTLFVVDREVRRAIDRRVEEDMASWVARLRHRLFEADAEQRARVLERLAELAPFPVRLLPLSGLPLAEPQAQRLASGETVSVDTEQGRVTYGQVDDSLAIALGPIPKGMAARRLRGLPPRGLPTPRSLLPPERLRGEGPGPPGENRPPRFGPPPRDEGGREPWVGFPYQDTYVLLVVLLAILIVIGGAVYLLLRPYERRIYALADVARRFGEGQLEARAPLGREDAIGALSLAFNHMAGRIAGLIARQQELLRAVSHELRTPLARLFFLVDDAQGVGDPEAKNRYLQRIESSLQDLDGLVAELLTFVRLEGEGEAAAPSPLAVGPVLAEVAATVADLRPGLEVAVASSEGEVAAVPRLLRRAVLNLATNAARHARQRIELAAEPVGASVRILVDDDGPGVPVEARQRVFDAFCRLDESRSTDAGGAGLGLAIVQRIMELHGGTAEVGDSPLGGARFALTFPAHPAQPV